MLGTLQIVTYDIGISILSTLTAKVLQLKWHVTCFPSLLLLSYQLSSRMPAVTSPAGVNARTPPKKPSVSQKKPVEPPGSSPPMPR